jgi:hypothetical protein
MGAEGLETIGCNAGETPFSEILGAQAGAIDSEAEYQGQLMQEAMTYLQAAWKALRTVETISDNPKESEAAGRARGFVDEAFGALDGGDG